MTSSSWTPTAVPGLRSRPARWGPEGATAEVGQIETPAGSVRVECYWLRRGIVWGRWLEAWMGQHRVRGEILDDASPEEIQAWVMEWVAEITGEEAEDAE